ncbi:MAG: hypothetical protein ACI4ML_13625 [Aristaeellaceae bacterium]
MKTPVTKDSLRNHLNYSWWKYLLLICLAAFGWNLIYTMTAYRPPEEKKVNIIVACMGEQEQLNAYMEDIRVNEMSDMEEMTSLFMYLDEMYGEMQLSTYIAAGEGDLYILAKDQFQSYAANGAFLPLEEMEGFTELCEAYGIDTDKGWRINTDVRERHLYGIPLSSLPGLKAYLYTNEEYYLSFVCNGGNDENTYKFLQILLRDMHTAPEPAAEPAAENEPAPTDAAEPASGGN